MQLLFFMVGVFLCVIYWRHWPVMLGLVLVVVIGLTLIALQMPLSLDATSPAHSDRPSEVR